jgi:hypothetical protein
MPLFVPVLAPWVIVTKNSGPGARAPETDRMITVAAKVSGSMYVEAVMLIMNFFVCCICVGHKYENVYYILRHNMLLGGRGRIMRSPAIFLIFVILFTAASIAVPIPLFPGNVIPALLEIHASEFVRYLEALTNGLTYGFITWLVFFVVDKKLEKSFLNGY